MVSFNTQLNDFGQLIVPQEFIFKNAKYKVIIEFPEPTDSISYIEESALNDNANDFLSESEVSYYLNIDND
jgi:hypothetical protein